MAVERNTPLYLKCSDPSRPLVRNIAEIIYLPYGENGEYDGRLTISAFIVSDARFTLSFPLNEANEAQLIKRAEKGNLLEKGIVKTTEDNGTYIKFMPDPDVFPEYAFQEGIVKEILQSTASQNKGLSISLNGAIVPDSF